MLYLYGIAAGDRERRLGEVKGIGRPARPVFSVPTAPWSLIVSTVDRSDLLTPDDAVAHSRVLEHVNRTETVIPVRLGTVAGSEEELKAVVATHQEALAALMHRVNGRVEMGIKVYWNDELLQETLARHIDLGGVRAESARDPARAYHIALEVGQLAEQITNDWREQIIRKITERLRPKADDMTIGKLSSIYMLCNVSFLIERQQAESFGAAVDQLSKDLNEKFRLHYVEDLPPFSFANLALGGPGDGGVLA